MATQNSAMAPGISWTVSLMPPKTKSTMRRTRMPKRWLTSECDSS
jgi:hypothetical protein